MEAKTQFMDMQDDLLIRYLLDEASKEEIKQVDDWRKADDACNKRFQEFRMLWEASKNLLDTQQEDGEAALLRFRKRAAERRAIKTNRYSLNSTRTWFRVAIILLLIPAAVWLYTISRAATEIKLATQKEAQTFNLPDGSLITLNHKSDLEYPRNFSENGRSVKLLKGEAFFKIAHDKTKPFVITAGKTLVKVVGTSFNVKYKEGNVEVIVETGIVELKTNNQIITLKAGEKAMVISGSEKLEKKQNTDQLYNYYRSKEFVANNTALWRVVEVLNEAYDSNIIIERKELRNLPLNTTFKDEPLDKILDIISRTFKISVVRKHGTILLK